MTNMREYMASAGQTHMPVSENIHVRFAEFEAPSKPVPPLPERELRRT